MVMQVRAWLCWAEDSKTLAIGALLCRRSERPCHRTTHDTEKSPPPHVHVLHRGKKDGRLTQVSTPEMGPGCLNYATKCPLWVMIRHPALHSITSSARPSSESGTVRPSALAVLRFMSSSTFVDCTTGRSAGFMPLRIFPV